MTFNYLGIARFARGSTALLTNYCFNVLSLVSSDNVVYLIRDLCSLAQELLLYRKLFKGY